MLKTYDAYLVGYYGMGNCGDDALMLASLMGAKRYLSLHHIKVATYSPVGVTGSGILPASLKETQSFKGQNRLLHYYHASRSRRIIFGGGSVFHSEQDINLKRHLLSLSNAKASMALGVSLGPFATQGAKTACRHFLNECGLVTVRDRASLNLAKRLAPNANVFATFDLAPSLCLHPEFKHYTQARRGIGVNVCPLPVDAFGTLCPDKEDARRSRLVLLIEQIWRITGEEVVLFSCNQHPRLGDDETLMAIKRRLAEDIPVKIMSYDGNPFRTLEALKGLRLVIGMRLHACIFSYMTLTPFFSLGYHKKCDGFCQEIGQDPEYQFAADNMDVDALLTQLQVGLHFGFNKPLLDPGQAVEQSQLNWKVQNEKSLFFRRHSLI